MDYTLPVTNKAEGRKLDGKALEDFQVQEIIDGIRKRLARLEAEAEAAANRYTVVFDIGPRNLGGGAVCWRARVLDHGIITAAETMEEAAVLVARQLTLLRARPIDDQSE